MFWSTLDERRIIVWMRLIAPVALAFWRYKIKAVSIITEERAFTSSTTTDRSFPTTTTMAAKTDVFTIATLVGVIFFGYTQTKQTSFSNYNL